jgi:hypothetical protein
MKFCLLVEVVYVKTIVFTRWQKTLMGKYLINTQTKVGEAEAAWNIF